jgi:hypothetical protein
MCAVASAAYAAYTNMGVPSREYPGLLDAYDLAPAERQPRMRAVVFEAWPRREIFSFSQAQRDRFLEAGGYCWWASGRPCRPVPAGSEDEGSAIERFPYIARWGKSVRQEESCHPRRCGPYKCGNAQIPGRACGPMEHPPNRSRMTNPQLRPSGLHAMPPSWQGRLVAASSVAEVIEVARDFVATFTPAEIGRLPEACRPPELVDANDISEYAFALVRHHCDDNEGSARLAFRLASFFSSASIRLSRMICPGDGRKEARIA